LGGGGGGGGWAGGGGGYYDALPSALIWHSVTQALPSARSGGTRQTNFCQFYSYMQNTKKRIRYEFKINIIS